MNQFCNQIADFCYSMKFKYDFEKRSLQEGFMICNLVLVHYVNMIC